MTEELIKSKERVQQHGEVFTPRWMVDLMLDIPGVKEATESIDATFLEPATGDGNFLVAILERKLAVVTKLFCNDQQQAQLESLWALASIYGIEFLEDNLQRARERMLELYTSWWKHNFDQELAQDSDFYRSALFLLEKNIVRGDTLTQKHPVTKEPIVFFEWKRTGQDLVEYEESRLDQELEAKTASGFAFIDSGPMGSVEDALFPSDLSTDSKLLSGTIEMKLAYRLEVD